MSCYFEQRYVRIYISIFAMILALLVGCENNSSITSVQAPEPTETVVPTPKLPARQSQARPQVLENLPPEAQQTPMADDPTVESIGSTKVPMADDPTVESIGSTKVPIANDSAIILKQAVENLKPGQIVFDVPQSMQMSNAQLVEVRLSDDLERDLKTGLNEKSETARIKVSPFMKARLEGLNFHIKSLTEESQALVPKDVIQWRWSVTPTELGEQKLILTLYARIKISNQPDEVINLKTFERSINVAVSPTNWLGENGKGILDTAIALSGAGFFAYGVTKWRWMRRVLRKKIFKS